MFIQPHDPDYVPEPMYPEYILLEDEHVLPAEEQPLPPIVSPTAESPGYVTESDPEADPEEYENDESEDGLDEEEEEEHLDSANSAIVVPTVEPASISLPPEAEVKRLLVMPTLPQSPLTSLYHHPLQGSIWLAALPSPPLPPLPPPLYIPATVDRRDDIPKTELPPLKNSCLFALGPIEVGYGIRVDPAEAVSEIAPMTLGKVNTRVTKLAELHKHDTQDLYALLEDAQDSRTRISQRVTMDSQRVDLLLEDRIAHQETILIVKEEAYAS
nr:hypothetical protein [Tanacetum cinerariifolium]